VNLFQGNPNINPAMSDAYDIGYLKKWDKLTFNTSFYINHTTDSFQFVRKERGDFIDGVPVVINTPFNLATEDRMGFEFTLNYSMKKWWKLNSSFNFFDVKTAGDYKYIDVNNQLVVIDFNKKATTWSAKLNSKISLPYKIDWQTTANYNAPQKNGQGITKGMAAANLAFSKDILKDMGTISFNVNDVFNSRKRIQQTQSPTLISNSEMQWRTRQITVSFTYRFNKKKTEKEKPRTTDNGDDYIGQ
jgi:outer membrane receptor protein involved in Fe transport